MIINKPQWKDAPKWAKYLAMDESGAWFWYSEKPKRDMVSWNQNGGEIKLAQHGLTSWEDSLEEKPATIEIHDHVQ